MLVVKKNIKFLLFYLFLISIPLQSLAGFLSLQIAPFYNEKAYPGEVTAKIWKDPDNHCAIERSTDPIRVDNIKNKSYVTFTVDAIYYTDC